MTDKEKVLSSIIGNIKAMDEQALLQLRQFMRKMESAKKNPPAKKEEK